MAYLTITDVESYNHYFGWYGGKMEQNGPWLDKFHAEHPDICIGISEYGTEGIINWHSNDPQCKDYTEEYQALYHEHLAQVFEDRPWVWATHCWNMFDFGCAARNEGGVAGRNNKGLMTIDRKTKKDSFYIYKAWWSDEPFVHICSKRYADRTENEIEVKVHPMLIPEQHPLATVRDSFNAVFVHGEACDDAMFMGRGAGKMPTASAVMGDIIIVMRNIVHDNCGWNGGVAYKNYPVKPIEETRSRYFLRLQVADKPGALANIAGVLGNNDVSIAQVVQKRARDGVAELVVITDSVLERHFNDALMIVKGMSVLREVSGIIRVYGD